MKADRSFPYLSQTAIRFGKQFRKATEREREREREREVARDLDDEEDILENSP
jgi:hypothetical protein